MLEIACLCPAAEMDFAQTGSLMKDRHLLQRQMSASGECALTRTIVAAYFGGKMQQAEITSVQKCMCIFVNQMRVLLNTLMHVVAY